MQDSNVAERGVIGANIVFNAPVPDMGPYSEKHFNDMKRLLCQRVKPSRFEHSVSVAETARKMAEAYGVDPDKAAMAGLLHDWDKSLTVDELRERIDRYNLDVDAATIAEMPWVLHGLTGAAVLADTHPEFDQELYQAIARHTLGALNMSKLDMILYVADKIEPNHDVKAYRKLYKKIGKMDLFTMYFKVQQRNMLYLVKSERPLDPSAVSVWNHCVALKA